MKALICLRGTDDAKVQEPGDLIDTGSQLDCCCGAFANIFASSQASSFLASPFVAGDEDTSDLSATVVTAAGSPFSVRVNKNPVAPGTFAGVQLDASIPDDNFQGISFLLSGAESTKVVVHSQARGTRIMKHISVSASDGMKLGKSADGYRRVTFDAVQLDVAPGDAVDQIVISTDVGASQPSFNVKDVRIDGLTVTKAVANGTQFYTVANGSFGSYRIGFAASARTPEHSSCGLDLQRHR